MFSSKLLLLIATAVHFDSWGIIHIPTVDASIFVDRWKWPKNNDEGGYTNIPVCIHYEQSSSTENKSGFYAWFPIQSNPSLDCVIERVQAALSNSWEKHSAVRFVNWKKCEDLTQQERDASIHLYINPDAPNNSFIGILSKGKGGDGTGDKQNGDDINNPFKATSLKPWGNNSQCIKWSWFAFSFRYHYDCAEQYAIHEFGHAIGFHHEWLHPLKPKDCQPDGETYDPNDSSYTFADPTYYDQDSIMVYNAQCADVTGERFGSKNLSPTDILGASLAYPPPEAENGIGEAANKIDGTKENESYRSLRSRKLSTLKSFLN